VTLDQASSIDRHVANVARSCSDHTRALRHITSVLSLECVKELSAVDWTIVTAYCSDLFGMSQKASIVLSVYRTNWHASSSIHRQEQMQPTVGVNYTGCR